MKPILFNTPMVQAILNGRKTMTRRVLGCKGKLYPGETLEQWCERRSVKPHYQPGDILWVRETWFCNECMPDCAGRENEDECPFNRVNESCYGYKAQYTDPSVVAKWRPSIFMPREAARIFLRVTGVMVECIQDITEEDAEREGIKARHDTACSGTSAKIAFAELWDSINKKRGYGWDINPWVWVISFERVNISEVTIDGTKL